jgi:hypothetical protein
LSLLALAVAIPARGQAPAASPASRLPADANAVMVVDVAKLADSPWGKQNNLRGKLASGYAGRPLPVPGTARQLAIGARLNPVGMTSAWQAAVIEMPAAPRLEPMLQAQGGYLDNVGGKPAAWTPKDAYYVALDGKTLGVLRPGQRQQVAAWVAGKSATALPPYVAKALAGKADAIFAFDLRDAVGPAAVNYALSMGELPALEDVESGEPELLAALASLTGTTITVKAGERLDAEWVIDFDKDVSALGARTGPVVIDVLKMAEAYEPGMEQWNFKAEGKRIVGKKAIDEEAFARLVALLAPPDAAGADAAEGAAGAPSDPAAAPKNKGSMAEASQAYYRAVAKKIDALGPKPSPTQGASALMSYARQIQQLPVLNVDPALLEWGNSVASTFTRAGQELAVGQTRAKAAAEGVASPTAYTTYAPTGGANSTPETRAAYRNAQQARRQVSQTERAAAADRAMTILNDVAPARGKVRAEMTQKYGIEF